MAIRSDGTLWTWGGNGNGQLGDGTFVNHIAPAQVTSVGTVNLASAGYWHSVVVKTDLSDVRVLKHGASAAHAAGELVKIDFLPDDTLVFDTNTESLMTSAQMQPPIF